MCPDGEADGVAWALRTPGELIEKFVFNRTLDAITAGPSVDADGKRIDKKLDKKEIPKRIHSTLEGYRQAALREHNAQKSARVGGGADELSESHQLPKDEGLVRRKNPMWPGARVVPAVTAAGVV